MSNSAELYEYPQLAKQIIGRDGKTLHVNEAWEKLWGVPFAALAGYNLFEDKQLIDAGIVPKLERVFEGESFTLPEMEYDRAGTPEVTGSSGKLWVRTYAYPIRNEHGRIEEIVLLQEDTSDNHYNQERIQLYQDIFLLSNDAIAIIDPAGRYLEQNDSHRNLLGYNDEELEGKTPSIHMGEGAFSELTRILAETGRYSGELVSHTKSGEEKQLHLSAFSVNNDDGSVRCYVGIKRDITEQKRAAQAAARWGQAQTELLEFSRELSTTLDLGRVLDLVVSRITKLTDLGTSALYLRQGKDLRLAATIPPIPADFPENLLHAFLDDHPTIRRVIETNQSIFIGDARNAEMSAAERQAVEARNLRSIFYLPLFVGSEVFGALIVASVGKKVVPSEADLEICNNYASIAALAIANAKLYDNSLRDAEELERNYSFTHSVLKNAPMGIHMYRLEHDGRLIFIGANQAADRILGVDNSQFVGMPLEEAFPPLADTEVSNRYRQIAREGGEWYNEQIVYDDGVIKGAFQIQAFQTLPGQMAVFFEDITATKQQEQNLRASEERFELAMRASSDGLWDWNMQTNVVYFSPRWKSMLGYRDEELENSFAVWEQLTDGEGRAKTMGLIDACIKGQADGFSSEFHMRHKDGHWIDILSRATLIRDANGAAARMVGTHVDISELRRSEESLRKSEIELKEAQRIAHLGSWHMDLATNEVYWSEELYNMYGFDSSLPPPLYTESMELFTPDSWERLSSAISRAVEQGMSYELELEMIPKDGRKKWMLARGELVRDARGKPDRVQGVVMDITERKQFEEMIWRQANFDSLTGLPNRRMFHDRFEQETKKALRTGLPIALLLIDLDRFKELNDTRGHDVGDLLLIEVAKRISGCVRTSDTVARLGGDEFIVILPELEDLNSIDRVAQIIIERLTDPFLIKDETAFITASIGISLYPNDTANLDDLFKNADQAMYASKGEGRNRYSFFTPELHEAARKRLALSNDLRSALENNQFKVFYQPIVDLATGELYKAEALIRWYHPERGVVNPMDFIPIAEETGLIVPIGDWVFKQAVEQAQRWQRKYHPLFQISVNKSPVQILHENCVSWRNHLVQQGMSGNSIAVEITEGVLLNSKVRANDSLLVLRDAGIQIAIDDFGTGYSSLAYLKEFDIDYLKIDKSFVMNLGEGTSDLALCEAIIVMAHRLGLKVIAEGVETAAQRDILVAAGCDYAQGYFYSKPILPEEFEKLLARNRK